MRNISERIFNEIAKNGMKVPIDRRRNSKESVFLDTESVMQPIVPMKSVFDECGDDYTPDLSFVKE